MRGRIACGILFGRGCLVRCRGEGLGSRGRWGRGGGDGVRERPGGVAGGDEVGDLGTDARLAGRADYEAD